MNLLILNGDATYNRGDRAILLGNILLLKKIFPDAKIAAFSYKPNRDKSWYNISFYKRSSIIQKIKGIIWADVIFWGGGELIQDDTSKVKIPYWFVNIMFLSLICRKKIIGLGQGLGPVRSKLNKLLSKLLLNRLSLFISRDNYSEKMIRDIGAKTDIISSYDPAILVSDIVRNDKQKLRNYLLKNGYDIKDSDKIVGVGVRRWFHQRSSWIPHKYAVKYKLRKIPGEAEFLEMKKNIALIVDHLSDRGYKVIFFPMYTPSHEADDKVSNEILQVMKNKKNGIVFKYDVSPAEYLEFISGTDLFFGIRLHSTILSSSVEVPSLTFYYVPKGKSYFEQLGTPENSFPIKSLLSSEETTKLFAKFDHVTDNSRQYSENIKKQMALMKKKLYELSFEIKKSIG